jgi:hypothetical protein
LRDSSLKMDSLSDTPNITNLIKTCIRTSGQCHILFSEEAGNDIICAEIVLLQKVLNDLVDLPDSDSWQYLSAPLRQCQADLEALRLKFGGRQSPRQEDDKTKISRTRTSTWYLSREDVDKALTAIKRCRTSFELDLGTYNL